MISFPLIFEKDDNGTFLVTSPALPELTSFGETMDEAIAHGKQAVEEALAARIDEWSEVPSVKRRNWPEGAYPATPSLLTLLKLELYQACREGGVTRAELTRRLGWHREQVDRLFRLDHASRLDQIETALAAVGRAAEVRTSPLANYP